MRVKLKKFLKHCQVMSFLKFFIPAIKINYYLKKFKKYYSNRKLLIAKEITKIHEEHLRIDAANFEN